MMNFKTNFINVVAAFFLMNLAACSSDDDENTQIDDSPKVVGYLFELAFSRIEGNDNADLIKTTYSFVNPQGKEEIGTFKEKVITSDKISSQLFTKLPATLTVKVKEDLIPDIQYTKEQYKLGSSISFAIRSLAEDQSLIDYKAVENESNFMLPVANLLKMYPDSIIFSYQIDEKGIITEITAAE